MNNLNASTLDFSELMPLLQLQDTEGVPALDELPNEQLVELLQTLDAELNQHHRDSQQDDEDKVKDDQDTKKGIDQDADVGSDGVAETKEAQTAQSSTRVRTYTARKMEIARLMKELPHLEGYVEFLKHQAAKAHNQNDSLQKTRLINSTLRESVHRQQFTMARLQSAMSLFRTRQERMVPMDAFIQLPRDNAKRVATVAALAPKILRDAKRFMRERTAFVDHDVQCQELASFPCPSSGAWCVEKFSVYPIQGSASVKQVFDALVFYTNLMDEMITEGTGDATVREESSELFLDGEITVSQNRMVRAASDGLKAEWNAMVSSQYSDDDDEADGSEIGAMAINAIGKDELFPYAPESRLRLDVTSALVVKAYASETPSASKKKRSSEARKRNAVVVTRHTFFTLHPGDEPVTTRQLREVCNRVAADGYLLFDMVQASVDDLVAAEGKSTP